jgi:hypothetical protein
MLGCRQGYAFHSCHCMSIGQWPRGAIKVTKLAFCSMEWPFYLEEIVNDPTGSSYIVPVASQTSSPRALCAATAPNILRMQGNGRLAYVAPALGWPISRRLRPI